MLILVYILDWKLKSDNHIPVNKFKMVRDAIFGEVSAWLPLSHVEPFQKYLSEINLLYSLGQQSSFTFLNYQRSAALLDGPFRLLLTCSTVPLNTTSFPRGVWHSGIKFPLVSGKHINKFVGAIPRMELRYPRYRHLALPPGVDRIGVKTLISDSIKTSNAKEIKFYRHQIGLLAFVLSQKSTPHSPIVLVDVESVAKSVGIEFFRDRCWCFDPDGKRSSEPTDRWLPKFEPALFYLRQFCEIKSLNVTTSPGIDQT